MAKSKRKLSQEQYDMLMRCSRKRDMTEWNKWRDENPNVKIFLIVANLTYAHLSEANLSEANLSYAELSHADLSGADLRKADLRGGRLYRAKLSGANLSYAQLGFADISYAELSYAHLSGANLCGADLWEADLSEAELEGANLREAHLKGSNFTLAKLDKSNLTGAKIYAWNTTDWSIKDIKCDYIFIDSLVKERLPKDRNFEKEEFEKIYEQLPSFEYVFKNGMNFIDIPIMSLVTQIINEDKPELKLEIDSISKKVRPSIKFTVSQKEFIEEALNIVKQTRNKVIQNLLEDKKKLQIQLEYAGDVRKQLIEEFKESQQREILDEIEKLSNNILTKEDIDNIVNKVVQFKANIGIAEINYGNLVNKVIKTVKKGIKDRQLMNDADAILEELKEQKMSKVKPQL